jgi:hypothetical protein
VKAKHELLIRGCLHQDWGMSRMGLAGFLCRMLSSSSILNCSGFRTFLFFVNAAEQIDFEIFGSFLGVTGHAWRDKAAFAKDICFSGVLILLSSGLKGFLLILFS